MRCGSRARGTDVDRIVSFPSQDSTLVGRLYLPDAPPDRPPVMVMAHGFSATIDGMVADRYAESFARIGVAVLLFDHLGFGRSGGEPRQRIDAWQQVIGYRDAISYVSSLPGVDASRLAVWGDSMSAGCAIVVAASDHRVTTLLAQVPALGGAPPPPDPDHATLATMVSLYARPILPPVSGAVQRPVAVVSADQLNHPSALTPVTAYRWFIEYGGRYGTRWQNWVTGVEREGAPYDPALAAAGVRVPTLFVIAADDEMPGSRSEVSRAAFATIPGPKEIHEIDGGHFGLLHHPSVLFDEATSVQQDFLSRVMSPT
jgi:pimeloyl-ACP methyl ester carboxylesterase